MKRTALILVAMLAISGTAEARRRHFNSTGGYSSNGVFGAGLELGAPTGLNAKWFFSPSSALDFGLGANYNYYVNASAGANVYIDYLWHPFAITEQPAFKLPFYFGAGVRDTFGDCDGCNIFGVRIPIGISFDFNDVPLDVFVQVVPTLDFLHDYNHAVFFDVDFSVGIRYWFI